MRKLAIAATTLFLMLMVGCFIKPDVATNMFNTMGLPLLFGIAGIRITFGLLLFGAASTSRWPMFLKSLGVLFIFGGLFVLVLGVDGVKSIVDSFYGGDVTMLRAGMLFGGFLMGLILYALILGKGDVDPEAVQTA